MQHVSSCRGRIASSAVARGSLDEIAEDETVAKSQALIQNISEAVVSNWYLGGLGGFVLWCSLCSGAFLIAVSS